MPLVLGVTGHRTLANPEAIDRAVRRALQRLRGRYPHTPFVCLSPIAEGADRLVAEAAQDVLDASLVVSLPLPADLYRDDFTASGSHTHFDALCDDADNVFELALQASREDVRPYEEPRNRQYAQMGALIVEHCDVLIAVWDGEPARGLGGTGDVVQWALDGRVPAEYQAAAAPDRPFYHPNETEVIHIHSGSAQVTVHTHEGVFAGEDVSETPGSDHRAALAQIEQYNADLQADPPTLNERQQSLQWVLGDRASDPACQTPIMRHLMAHYTQADGLAQHLRAQYRGRLRSIYGLSAVAVFVSALAGVYPVLVAVDLLVVGLAYGLLKHAERQNMEARFLKTRTLAEGLRVALFWNGAGVDARLRDFYLNTYATELAFCRIAQKNMEVQRWRSVDPFADDTPCLSPGDVRTLWIDDQIDYFSRTRARLRARGRRMGWVTTTAYRIAFLLAVALAGVALFMDPIQPTFNALALAMSLILAAGVSVRSYKEKLGVDAFATHYAKAERLFRTANAQWTALHDASPGDPDTERASVHRLLVTLGRETLLEHGDWLWTNQERSVDVPKAG